MKSHALSFLGLVTLSFVLACNSSEPANGTVKCGAVDKSCPSGYQCSDITGTCWRVGTLPDATVPATLDATVSIDNAGTADTRGPGLDTADAKDAGREVAIDGVIDTSEAGSDLVPAIDGVIDLVRDGSASAETPADRPASQPDVPDVAPDLAPDMPDVAPDAPPAPDCIQDKDCPGACQSCVANVCVAVKGKDDPNGRCTGTCDSAGACKAKQGQACATAGQCANGVCSPDGICCNRACTGACEACDFPAALGTCSPVSGKSHSGHTNCNGTTAECAGSCTGASDGQCAWPTSACGPATSCVTQTNAQSQAVATTFTAQGACSAGTCNKPAATACAGALVCASATACKDTCSADSDCLSDHYCSGTACVAKVANGHTCGVAAECTSGNCVDGYCCDSGCNGTCQACNVAGKEGTCSNVPADQTGARGCESSCDGAGNCTGNGVCGYGYSTCTRNPTILHRMDLTCDNGTLRSPRQDIDLSSGYSNYTCGNRYQTGCIDDGTFDAYYMEWCEYASPTCIARSNGMYSCDPGAVPSGSCAPVKLHRRVFDCKGTAQSGEQVIDLVATGYLNYYCNNRFQASCVDDGSWDGYYSEWCEYKCQ